MLQPIKTLTVSKIQTVPLLSMHDLFDWDASHTRSQTAPQRAAFRPPRDGSRRRLEWTANGRHRVQNVQAFDREANDCEVGSHLVMEMRMQWIFGVDYIKQTRTNHKLCWSPDRAKSKWASSPRSECSQQPDTETQRQCIPTSAGSECAGC